MCWWLMEEPEQRHCTNCREPLRPEARFCSACGFAAAGRNGDPGQPGWIARSLRELDTRVGTALAAEGAAAASLAADAVARIGSVKRRHRALLHDGARALADSAQEASVVSGALALGMSPDDWSLAGKASDVRLTGALLTVSGQVAALLAQCITLKASQILETIASDFGPSSPTDSSNLPQQVERLQEIATVFAVQARHSSATLHRCAASLGIADMIPSRVQPYQEMLNAMIHAGTMDSSASIEHYSQVGIRAVNDLSMAASSCPVSELLILSVVAEAELAVASAEGAYLRITQTDHHYQVLASIDCMLARVALMDMSTHLSTYIALALLHARSTDDESASMRLAQQRGVASAAIGAMFLASALRQIAESFNLVGAQEIIAGYEVGWRGRWPVALILPT